METMSRMLLLAALVIAPAPARAGPDADPSGHWEGVVEAPSAQVAIEIDLAKDRKGGLVGTFGNPAEGLSGLPLASIAVAGNTVTLVVAATTGGGTFRGALSADRRALSGDFVVSDGKATLPFHLKRTGDARIAPPPRSPPVSRALEGRWSGTLAVDGKQLPVVLAMANQPDGTATGTLTTGGLTLPIALTQSADGVRVDVPSVRGSYTGVLDGAGTQLTGTWTQRSLALPLTLRRSPR